MPVIPPKDVEAPVAAPELSAVTAAALTPNMFGDRFGAGPLTLALRDSFSFVSIAKTPGGGAPASFVNALPITTRRGIVIGPGNTFVSQETFALTSDPAPATLTMLDNAAVHNQVAPGGSFVFGRGDLLIGGSIDGATYNISYAYDALLSLPNPSQGVTGRAKISEDNNPIPQDRFIFNYDFFANTSLSRNGWDVHRFNVGVEKTFFNQVMSIEARLPIASTLDSDIRGVEATNGEVGNLRLLLKALLYDTQTVHFAGGLGIDLPTADDTRLYFGNTELIRIENEAVILIPYVAASFTPSERLFGQLWLSMEFDTNGNPVLVNGAGGLAGLGRLHDSTFLVADAQLGYWVIRSTNSADFLQGLAPFVELHYGTTVEDADIVRGDGVTLGSQANRIDEMNLAAGVVMFLGDRFNLSVGAVMPLRNDNDRSFDFQLGVRANWLFGPSTRSRRVAAAGF